MPNTFEEASRATEEMFANDNNGEQMVEEVMEEVTEDTPQDLTPEQAAEQNEAQQEQIATEEQMLEDATQTAEDATQAVVEREQELSQVMMELEALRRQNERLQGAITELSDRNEERVIEEALTPPTLDMSNLAFADAETQQAAIAKFTEEMSRYDRQQFEKEFSPVIEFAKRGMRDAEKTEVMKALAEIPELGNVQELMPQAERIIENNKWLSSGDIPTDEKYIIALTMARGINSINNPPAPPEKPKEPTVDELMAMYNQNPAFREMVEKQRIEEVKQSQQVPPMSASSGAVNAALNIKEKPQTLEEASQRTREEFSRIFG